MLLINQRFIFYLFIFFTNYHQIVFVLQPCFFLQYISREFLICFQQVSKRQQKKSWPICPYHAYIIWLLKFDSFILQDHSRSTRLMKEILFSAKETKHHRRYVTLFLILDFFFSFWSQPVFWLISRLTCVALFNFLSVSQAWIWCVIFS